MTSNSLTHTQEIVRNEKLVQASILIGTFGLVTCFMGLYPGITGAEPQSGVGVLQIMAILTGMAFMILGAVIFVKVSFYPHTRANLAQQIALRLCLTGILFAAAAGFADLLGYGSNPPGGPEEIPILGPYQAAGMVFGYFVAAIGVLVYAVAGPDENGTFSSP
jgi:hypothetical protein